MESIIREIIGAVSGELGISASDIVSARRGSPIAEARHIAIRLSYDRLWQHTSLTRIGRSFNRIHSTVSHSITRTRCLERTDEVFRDKIERCRTAVARLAIQDPVPQLRPYAVGPASWDFAMLVFAYSESQARSIVSLGGYDVEYTDARSRVVEQTAHIMALRQSDTQPHIVDDLPSCSECSEWGPDALMDGVCSSCVEALEAA